MNNKPYAIHHANDQKVRNIFYAGYRTQLDAGCGLICKVFDDRMKGKERDYKILIFGYPGVGKGTYPYALMKLILEDPTRGFIENAKKKRSDLKSNLCLIHVPCLKMATQYRGRTRLLDTKLRELENDVKTNIPCLVVLDELDAFSPKHAEVPSGTLQVWTHKFLDEKERGIIVLGIVNYPVHLYPAVLDRFQQSFYFGPPTQDTIVEILDHYGIPSPKEVSTRLCLERTVMTRQLVGGIRDIIETKGGDGDNLKKLEPEIIVNFLSSYMNTSREDVEIYESQNRLYISNAELAQDIWVKMIHSMTGE